MEDLNNILQLPERCLLNKKITKAFFKRNFELTNIEKKLLDDVNIILNVDWFAGISPANANINVYKDEDWLYEEVECISVQTAEAGFETNYRHIAELVQKYIPYPVLLCIWFNDAFVLNTCDKKINRNDNTKRIIDRQHTSEPIKLAAVTEQQQQFLNSLAFATLDKTNLKTFYDAYTQRIIALQTTALGGAYTPRTQSRTTADVQRLEEINALQKEIISLQNQAKKESQLNKRVEVNTQLQQIKRQIEVLKQQIIAD